ncbi:MAG: virulence factor [Paracoccus sp. (in: a-proteobacteria)]|uniref:virulence factor n=1 Tax=Paracoccus sp. TaxID=267 RepID=UPI0026E0F7D1|nr:virulence factor [Paracoccus sp. (in: a-proteobacteria)]MDO5614224.1 virulence factor [Paracoccus sp. (in: a-proteobacteria)]
MSELTLVFWRDIPAQVTLGKGRSAQRVILAERFEKAIDRAAMKAGLSGSDAYLNEWRRVTVPGDDPQAEAARIEAEYDDDRLRALIARDGFAT